MQRQLESAVPSARSERRDILMGLANINLGGAPMSSVDAGVGDAGADGTC